MVLPRPRNVRSEFCARALLIVLELVIFSWVRTAGFLAISDDDYARVVISQNFAASPTWDPSGTSWLPFPFLHQGTAMMLFSASIEFARAWAFICACVGTLLLYEAARRWQLRVGLAFAAAAAGALLPDSIFLSAATVPEYLTAALVVFALTTLGAPESDRLGPSLGGLCLLLAAASRYEAWPVACVFASLRIWDAYRTRSLGPLLSAGIALFFPLLWLLHGIIGHGNAFFFVKRVVDYKVALEGGASNGDGAAAYLKALLLAEPEAILVTAGLAGLAAIKSHALKGDGSWLRAWLPLIVMGLVLALGAVGSGAPTHHPERALLPIWLLLVLTSASLIERAHLSWKEAALPVIVGLGLGLSLRGSDVFERERFTDRRKEEALGKRLLALAGPSAPIGLQMDDYGYFAVMAAAGRPHRFEVFDTHDPRAQVAAHSPLDRYRDDGGCVFVVPARQPQAAAEREIETFSKWSIRQFEHCTQKAAENSSLESSFPSQRPPANSSRRFRLSAKF